MEGIADLIDKDIRFAKDDKDKITLKYLALLEETPDQIHIIDSLLVSYTGGEGDLYETASRIHKAAPMSGHPMGYFMAKTILAHQPREPLVENMGNPFAFLQR